MTRLRGRLGLAVICLVAAAIRWRLLATPLERDEGEYAYGGQLLLDGVFPHSELYSLKLPGIYAAYAAALALFGETEWGIHVALLLVNTATTLVFAALASRLTTPRIALLAAAAFSVLSLGAGVHGVFANAEHFALLPALAGLVLALRACESGRTRDFAAAGLTLGLAVSVKQHAALLALAAPLWLLLAARPGSAEPAARRRWLLRLGALGAGAALPLLACVAIAAACGALDSLWFWTFEYAWLYAAPVPWAEAVINLRDGLLGAAFGAPYLWGLALVGLCAPIWDRELRPNAARLGGFAALSLLATTPGLLFRPHYFLLALPAVALFAAVGAEALVRLALGRGRTRAVAAFTSLLVLSAALQSLYFQRRFLFQLPPTRAARSVFLPNGFAEMGRLGRSLALRTQPDDRIAVLGSEPEILFHARRRSATGFVYMYELVKPHSYADRMQQQLIREIEAAQPELIVFVNTPYTWLVDARAPRRIFDWMGTYLSSNYDLEGQVLLRGQRSSFLWDDAARSADRPTALQRWVEVYRRRAGGSPSEPREPR